MEEEDLLYRKSYFDKQEGIISEDKLNVLYLFIYCVLQRPYDWSKLKNVSLT